MNTRSKLITWEIVLCSLDGVILLLYVLDLITLKPLLIASYLISLVTTFYWFSRTDEIDKVASK